MTSFDIIHEKTMSMKQKIMYTAGRNVWIVLRHVVRELKAGCAAVRAA